jgi:hypothetical protein
LFFESTGTIHGPGHLGIFCACEVELFTYHYYPTAVSVLGNNTFSWSSDQWPILGAPLARPLVPCDVTTAGASRKTKGRNTPAGK